MLRARKKKGRPQAASLVKDPGGTYFRAFGTIIGPASLTFVFGMGTRVSLQADYRENPSGPIRTRRRIMKSKWIWHLIKVARHFSISTGQLRRSHALHSQPIDLVVFQGSSDRVNETLSWGWLHAYMLSAFITTVHSYPAMPLA